MQQNYVHRARVDWAGLRGKVAQAIPSPQTIPDTYPAIRYALHLLDDPHTQFLPPEDAHALLEQEQVIGLGLMAMYPERIVVTVNAGGAAEHAGVRVGDRIERINDAATAQMTSADFFNALFSGTILRLTLQRAGDISDIRVTIQHAEYHYPVEGPHGQRLPDSIGYIELPGLAASQPIFHQYAGLVQQHIREIDQPAACGWIVDLRGNLGGDPWDMLAGIGPILGEGTVGAYVYPTGRREAWVYRNGQAWRGDEVWAQVDHPYQLKQPLPPVAVLTDAQTASAGEAVLVAFRGRPDTRTFGQATAGVPTHRDAKTLSDGALLLLTLALDADRMGQTYDAPIAPDEAIRTVPKLVGTARDPVVLSAQAWLQAQPACADRATSISH
jgi:C-terminal processing protease CtpA/Prc